MSGRPPPGDAGIGKYGALGLAFMAAVVSAAISWGIELDRSDQASEQITSLSNRLNTLALQIHNNALTIATLRSETDAEARRGDENAARVRAIADEHYRTAAVLAELIARLKALEDARVERRVR